MIDRWLPFSIGPQFLYFDRARELHDDLGYWYRFLDRVKGNVGNLGRLPPDQLRDHDMTQGYLASFARNFGVNPFTD